MKIGAMNHPRRNVVDEIGWIADMGMDFVDLTLEPPAAAAWLVDAGRIRKILAQRGLGVVGHTAYYLPLASPFERLRQSSVEEIRRCLTVFAELGARWMNVHPARHSPMHDREFTIQRNLQSLGELLETSRSVGVGLMIENLPGDYNSAEQLGELLDPLPELGLHLDIGHANLHVKQNTTEGILAAYGTRLRHVHLHDNKGGHDDLHMPLGAGTIDISHYIRALKQSGYDDTITLEVFTPDPHYLAYSRDVLRRLWDSTD